MLSLQENQARGFSEDLRQELDIVDRLRKDISIAWRFLGQEGNVDTVFNHISVRVPASSEGLPMFLLNPWDRFAVDCMPEDFVLCDQNGSLDPRDRGRVNNTAIALHGALQSSQSGSNVVIHLHSPAAVAIAATNEQIFPANQTTMEFFDQISYIPYGGLIDEASEGARIAALLQGKDLAILRSHGQLVVGDSIQQAVYRAYYLEKSCQIHLSMMGIASNSMLFPDIELCRATGSQLRSSAAEVLHLFWSGITRRVEALERA